jgi:hypothetical protein
VQAGQNKARLTLSYPGSSPSLVEAKSYELEIVEKPQPGRVR